MPNRRQTVFQWLGGIVRADIPAMRQTLLGAALLALITGGWAYFRTGPQPITIDFNSVQGCSQGKLTDIAKRQMDDIPLTNGADSLTICDDQSLQAVRSELPRALANRIPGCLDWRGKESGGLMLVRKSDAVCGLPDGKGYICDAVNARHPLGNSAVGDSMEPVAPCPAELLRRFGFQS